MKYIQNTAKTRMFIDKSTIYFSNGKQSCGNTFMLSVLPMSLYKIEKNYRTTLSKGWENIIFHP